MYGASAFGWSYYGQIAEDSLVGGDNTDSRFGVCGYGWPYLGALPGIYLPVRPPHKIVKGKAVQDGQIVMGSFVPVTKPPEEKKVPKEKPVTSVKFWPTPETFEREETIVVPKEIEPEPVIAQPFVPEPKETIVTLPPVPVEERRKTVVDRIVDFGPEVRLRALSDRKYLLRLAEDSYLTGVMPADPELRKLIEDIKLTGILTF